MISTNPRACEDTGDEDRLTLSRVQLPGVERDSHGKPLLPLVTSTLYGFGHLIRLTEQLLLKLFTEGQLSGTTHTCVGQELCQISVVRALIDPEDVILSNHRNHGHFLAYSGDFDGLVAEIMGRETGVCRGIGGSQHLAFRHFHSNGVQGGMTAIGVGHALAEKRRRSNAIVVCFIGDGTLGEGLTYESLNLASIWQLPMLFVVEHNGIAQTTNTADTIGGSIVARGQAFGLQAWRCDDTDPRFLESVAAIVRRVRETRRPGFLVIDTMRLGPHSKGDDLRSAAEIQRIRERDPLEQLGRALSREQRSDIEHRNAEFIRGVRERAGAAPEPQYAVVPRHVYRLAANGRPPRTVRDPAVPSENVRCSLNQALRRMLTRDQRVIVLGEDLHEPYGGAFKVTAGLSAEFTGRVISTPISEAGVVGTAIGLALAGYRPIVEIMFADFLTLAMDQIYNHAVKFGAMFEHSRVPLVIRTPSGGRRGYGPTHSQSPENLMSAVPGLTVLAASHRHDNGALLEAAALHWDYPVVFFEHKLVYGLTQDCGEYEVLPSDPADPGADLFPVLARRQIAPELTIVAYGGTLHVVEQAAEALEREDLSVEIVAPAMLQPFPKHTLLKLLMHRSTIVVIEESPAGPGFGSELAAALLESGYRGRLRRLTPPAVPIPAARSLESLILPNERRLFDALVRVVTEQ